MCVCVEGGGGGRGEVVLDKFAKFFTQGMMHFLRRVVFIAWSGESGADMKWRMIFKPWLSLFYLFLLSFV